MLKHLDFDPARGSPLSEEAYQSVREHLGLDLQDALYFAHGGADAVSKVFQAVYMQTARQTGCNHFLMPAASGAHWQSCFCDLQLLDCTASIVLLNANGQLTKEALEKAIKPRTALLTMSWAHGLTGVVHPIWELAQTCRERNILIHVDASDVIGCLDFRFRDYEIDFLTFDGDCLGIDGFTGGIVVKGGLQFKPFGFEQSSGPWELINSAFQRRSRTFDHLCTETARLRGKFEREIKRAFSDAVVFFENGERLSHCSTIAVPGAASSSLQFLLQQRGISAAFGRRRFMPLAKDLVACGINPLLAHCAAAFQFTSKTTEEEINRLTESVIGSAEHLRALSKSFMECAG